MWCAWMEHDVADFVSRLNQKVSACGAVQSGRSRVVPFPAPRWLNRPAFQGPADEHQDDAGLCKRGAGGHEAVGDGEVRHRWDGPCDCTQGADRALTP